MMSYLGQLAARTLNRLPIVQPRLPARFEPSRISAGGLTEESIEREVVDRGVGSIARAPQPVAAPSSAPLDRSIDRHDEVALARVEHAADPIEPLPIRSGVADPIGPQTARPAITSVLDPPRSTPRPSIPITSPAIIEHTTQTTIVERITPMHTTVLEKIEPSAPQPSRPEVIERTILIERVSPAIDTPPMLTPRSGPTTVTPGSVAIMPQHIQPYVPPVPERTPAPEPEPAPIIHVSIGRIEVRAVTSPAPAAPQPANVAPAPKLSLDDYLRGVRR